MQMIQKGDHVRYRGELRVVTSVIRSGIAPSGWLVECDGPEDAHGIMAAPRRTGLMDAGNFEVGDGS